MKNILVISCAQRREKGASKQVVRFHSADRYDKVPLEFKLERRFRVTSIKKSRMPYSPGDPSTMILSTTNVNPFRTKHSSKRRREGFLYFVIVLETILILVLLQSRNRHQYLQHSQLGYNLHPFYKAAKIYPTDTQIARVWHSNGSPLINPDLKTGTCWCSGGNEYCMCTPSLGRCYYLSLKLNCIVYQSQPYLPRISATQ